MPQEPYPNAVLLTAKQVMVMLSLGNREFRLVRKDAPFPRPVVVGKGPKGQPRHRWRKSEIMAYALLLGRDG